MFCVFPSNGETIRQFFLKVLKKLTRGRVEKKLEVRNMKKSVREVSEQMMQRGVVKTGRAPACQRIRASGVTS